MGNRKPEAADTDYVISDNLKSGYYILCYNSAKGSFFYSDFEAEEFDETKLRLETTDFDGDNIINYVEYDDECLDDYGCESDGKGSGCSFYKVGE